MGRTRRELVRQGVVAGAAVLLSGGCAGTGKEATRRNPAVEALRVGFDGDLVFPGDRGYDAARSVHWRSVTTDKQPAVIARCTGEADIARCIELARRESLPLAIRGGGHCFAGWGTCDAGIVIDTSRMKTVQLDAGNATVQVGAGVLTQELFSVTSKEGFLPVLGQCPSVGISGFTLGGGLGWLSARYGAACDNLLQVKLVTADGRRLTASADENPDLFWACRGGGGNFGVVTSLSFRLHPLEEVTAGRLDYRMADARALLRAFADIMASAPDELQASLSMSQGEEAIVSILLCWSGGARGGAEVARQFRSIASPLAETVQRRPYVETFAMYQASRASHNALRGIYMESLSEGSIDQILAAFMRNPGRGAAIGLDHFMHGAVCRVPADAAAFECRTAGSIHGWISAEWDDPGNADSLNAWIDDTRSRLQPPGTGRTYVNFPPDEESGDVSIAYPGNCARLSALKNQYDPTNMFQKNYNIPPGGE